MPVLEYLGHLGNGKTGPQSKKLCEWICRNSNFSTQNIVSNEIILKPKDHLNGELHLLKEFLKTNPSALNHVEGYKKSNSHFSPQILHLIKSCSSLKVIGSYT